MKAAEISLKCQKSEAYLTEICPLDRRTGQRVPVADSGRRHRQALAESCEQDERQRSGQAHPKRTHDDPQLATTRSMRW